MNRVVFWNSKQQTRIRFEGVVFLQRAVVDGKKSWEMTVFKDGEWDRKVIPYAGNQLEYFGEEDYLR